MRSTIFIHLLLIFFSICSAAGQAKVSVRLFTYDKPEKLILSPVVGEYILCWPSGQYQILTNDSLYVSGQNDKLTVNMGHKVIRTDSIQIYPDRADRNLMAVQTHDRHRIYRGQFRLKVIDKMPLLINILDSDSYLKGVISAEIEAESPLEALKAQTIVSRSYALTNLERHQNFGCDFCDLTHCQIYRGYYAELPATNRAVEETFGLVMTLNGRIAEALFSANCGGWTATTNEMWGFASANEPVKDDQCHQFSHFSWQYELSYNEMHEILQNDPRSNPGDHLRSVRVTEYGPSKRVVEVRISGETQKNIDGFTFWSILSHKLKWGKIKSTRFVLKQINNRFVFEGHGFGHGIGLCQSGAIARAKRGDSYQQILKHYFPNWQLQTKRTDHKLEIRY